MPILHNLKFGLIAGLSARVQSWVAVPVGYTLFGFFVGTHFARVHARVVGFPSALERRVLSLDLVRA